MSAVSNTDLIQGETLQEAYESACREAQYSGGSEYSGLINMSNGVVSASVHHVSEGPGHWVSADDGTLLMLPWDAARAVESLIERNVVRKWEEAMAIRVAEPKPGSLKQATITVDLTVGTLGEAIERARPAGEGVYSVEKIRDNRKYSRKNTAESGASEVQYYLAVAYHPDQTHLQELSGDPYDSMSSARIVAEALAKEQQDQSSGIPRYAKVAIRAKKIKSGKPDLVLLENVLVKHPVTYMVTFAKVGAPTNKWQTAGVYAS